MPNQALIALRDEIVSDPEVLGYKTSPTDWKGDQQVADLLNDPVDGATIRRKQIEPRELLESLDVTEWRALSAADRQYVQLLLQGSRINADASPIFDGLTTVFDGGSPNTRASLVAKISRQGSRAEVLWGEGQRVTAGQVGRAFNLIGA